MKQRTGRSVFDLEDDFRELLATAAEQRIELPNRERLSGYQRFLQREGNILAKDPELFFPLAWNAAQDSPVRQDAESSLLRPTGPWLRRLNPSEDELRLILIQHRQHKSSVDVLAMSSDGDRVISGDKGGKVVLTNSLTGKVKVLQEAGQELLSASADVRRGLTCDRDGTVFCWDLNDVDQPEMCRLLGVCLRTREVKGQWSSASMSLSADGQCAVSKDAEATVALWDLQDFSAPRKQVLDGAVGEISLSSDGRRGVTTSADGPVVWDLRQFGKPRRSVLGKRRLWSSAISSDGNRVVSIARGGNLANQVIVWDLKRFETPRHLALKCSSDVCDTSMSSNGHRLLLKLMDGTLVLWDLQQFDAPRSQVLSTEHGVTSIVLSMDGRVAVAGLMMMGTAPPLVCWDLREFGQPRQSWLPAPTDWVTDVALSADGRRAVSADETGAITCWDTREALHKSASRAAPYLTKVLAVSVSSDGRRAVSLHAGHHLGTNPDGMTIAYDSNRVMTWDLKHFDRPNRRMLDEGTLTKGQDSVFSSDGFRTVLRGDDKSELICWDLHDFAGPKKQVLAGSHNRITAVSLSSDGQTIASGDSDGRVIYWDVRDFDHPKALVLKEPQLQLGSSVETVAAFETDSWQRALSGVPASAFDFVINQIVKTAAALENPLVVRTCLSSDGRRVASIADSGTVICWDLPTLKTSLKHVLQAAHVGTKVCLSWDGNRLWVVRYSELICWDLHDIDRPRKQVLDGMSEMTRVAVAGNGSCAVVGDKGGKVTYWDLQEFAMPQKHVLQGHYGEITAVAVRSDGRRAISGDEHGRLICWDLENRRTLSVFWWQGPITAVALAGHAPLVCVGDMVGRIGFFLVEE